MPGKLTHHQFLDKVVAIHGDHYRYLEEYQSAKIPIRILCKIHQFEFSQTPNKHLSGNGCVFCARQRIGDSKRDTVESFIAKAKKVHLGNDFDYSRVSYLRASSIIEIIHVSCGRSFWQTPNNHLRGHGCTHCKTKFPLGIDGFIEKAIKVHGNKFDYSMIMEYGDNKDYLPIRCTVCNFEFYQVASNHLGGNGCPQCAGHYVFGTDSFIERAKNVHGDIYDYSASEYVDCQVKIAIRCRTCDRYFDQLPYSHLNGNGCPICPCRRSKSENKWLDSLGIPNEWRNTILVLNGKKVVKTDAFDPTINTIYEFYGDYWHGNPEIYSTDRIHPHTGKTFGELYRATLQREDVIKQAGYNLVSIWETQWKKFNEQANLQEDFGTP
jgi:hypothetical protein